MKKGKILIIGMLFMLLCSGCTSSSGNLESITLNDYKKLIKNKETFVLEMMSTDCTHCQSLKPKLQKIVKEYGITIKVINLQKLSSNDLKEFTDIIGTSATPTIIFYKDGEEKSVATRINGDVSKEKIIEKFKDNEVIK